MEVGGQCQTLLTKVLACETLPYDNEINNRAAKAALQTPFQSLESQSEAKVDNDYTWEAKLGEVKAEMDETWICLMDFPLKVISNGSFCGRQVNT